ncbi:MULTISPECIES: PilZ domain-containing protein [unclassified Novosphingobium]|uniref:PilZ domain-containing protein n=1 Tax=unclassified Novosphingobium TaxID=2644732 RepID=UPI0025DDD853|nr:MULTISPECIES: PilZ domain-containing protein [unclassified Novosphingobium]HQV02891.1 PilZ domain-containing protein [Novosphingobium sp.]
MAAKLKLESVSSRPARPQTRRVARLFAHSRATIRSSHGDRSKARIRDVSTFGCALECDAAWLRTGMFVGIAVTSDWTIQAVVRWVRDSRAGVEFLRPISEAEVREISED